MKSYKTLLTLLLLSCIPFIIGSGEKVFAKIKWVTGEAFKIERKVPISPLTKGGYPVSNIVANCEEVCINELSIRKPGFVQQTAYVNTTKWKFNIKVMEENIKIVDNEGYLDREYRLISGEPTYAGVWTSGDHTEVVTIRAEDGILFWTKILGHDIETYTFSCSSPKRKF